MNQMAKLLPKKWSEKGNRILQDFTVYKVNLIPTPADQKPNATH